MQSPNAVDDLLSALSSILWRCTVIAFGLLIFWGALLLFAPNLTYTVQTHFIPINRPQFYIIHYSALGLAKLATLWLFVMPWIAVKLTIRARRRQSPQDVAGLAS
ncbi:MAG TPA: hypothetical protein PLM14_02670 [Candidatus Hydrogenedentes bacterium]|nr:hypothetical protein [Candidatus Hydrogenedentota bacterium]HQE81874.1 hypothetical protein [Candidatus Hydrogenedentota bacterium]HQH51159.1 hypothetical protein [Candidatus Hydrogenedentota bacterium]HQM47465.1 hypothetical protein [Candidatus Hydrogenedentota bacterium]